MTNLPTVRRSRVPLVVCVAFLLVLSAACQGEPPPPTPSPLPVAACAVLRSVEADADLVSLYARVADQIAAGALERRDYLSWGFPEAALQAGIDPRQSALRAIAGWLDLTLWRQGLAREWSFAALYDVFRRDDGATDFLVDIGGYGTDVAVAFYRFRQSLQALADDVAFPVRGSARPGGLSQSWRKDDCAIRVRLDELRKRWGCESLLKNRPERPDDFDLQLVRLGHKHPYLTWTALGLPQCEPSDRPWPTNCVDLALQKPFLPHCGPAPAAGTGGP